MTHTSITIGWLYPELMATYGDYGNIIVLTKRCEWRNIKVFVKTFSLGDWKDFDSVDILFMGGAQDRQQKIVSDDLFNHNARKKNVLHKAIHDGITGLYICGAYQFLGKYYQDADGEKVPCTGILDFYTKNPGLSKKRLIGNIVTKWNGTMLVGFENHGGRTYLPQSLSPFAAVVKGYGNNGEDKTEGIWYKNTFGTYFHGPLLPKNPLFADYLIKLALEKKYGTGVQLSPLPDSVADTARHVIIHRMQ